MKVVRRKFGCSSAIAVVKRCRDRSGGERRSPPRSRSDVYECWTNGFDIVAGGKWALRLEVPSFAKQLHPGSSESKLKTQEGA
jgi:hypothetical protein